MDLFGGENYQVNYVINLQNNASAGINNFVNSVNRLAAVSAQLQEFANKFNTITAGFRRPMTLKINVGNAISKLDRVEKKLQRISSLASKSGITIGATTTGASTQTPRSTGGSRAASVGRNRGIIPSNIGYRVLGPSMLDSGGIGVLDMFKGMGVMYGISALGSAAREIVNQSVDYQNVMQTAKNILKTNYKGSGFNAAFSGMEHIAREIGVETKYTAVEVADMVKFLAMAGLDINAINNSARPIADIALIGDSDLGQTADVMTNIMTAYGIGSDKMRNTADVMTRTFTMSNTTLMEMAESLKYAAPLLSLNKVPFETAAAMIGILGDAGVKSSQAGTTIRTIMNNLMNPTAKQKAEWERLGIKTRDENGNLRALNEIFGELNSAREAGLGVDIYKLFRLTATSGAGALMTHVAKWNQIIEENFNSEGLSEKLAEAKKNTVAGLWAQFKSAFIEGGLKEFEGNENIIKQYLRQGISWLKTDEFTKLLHDATSLVADMGGALLNFTRIIVNFYEKFKPIVNLWLKFQLYAKGALVILRSLKAVWQSSLYMISKIPAGNAMFAGGIGNGAYGVPGILGMISSSWATHDKAWMGGSIAAHRDLLMKKQLLMKQRMGWAGPAGIFGAGLGGFLGDAIDSEGGAGWGAAAGGALFAALPLLFSSGPVGWVVGGVIAAGAAITGVILKTQQAAEKAAKVVNEYKDSLQTLGINEIQLSTSEDYIQAKLRITTSILHDANEKLSLSIQLWDKYIKTKAGLADEETDEGKLFSDSSAYQTLNMVKEKFDSIWLDYYDRGKAYSDILESDKIKDLIGSPSLAKKGTVAIKTYTLEDGQGNFITYDLFGTYGYKTGQFQGYREDISKYGALQWALTGGGKDMADRKIEQFIKALARAKTWDEYLKINNEFINENIIDPDYSKSMKGKDAEAIAKETGNQLSEFLTYPEVAIPWNKVIWGEYNTVVDKIDPFFKAINAYRTNGTPIPIETLQNYLSVFGSPFFDTSKGVFGSPQWIDAIRNNLQTKNANEQRVELEEAFKIMEGVVGNLGGDYWQYFLPFYNGGIWEGLYNSADDTNKPSFPHAFIPDQKLDGYSYITKPSLINQIWSGYDGGVYALKSGNGWAIPGVFNSYKPQQEIPHPTNNSSSDFHSPLSTKNYNVTINMNVEGLTDEQIVERIKNTVIETFATVAQNN